MEMRVDLECLFQFTARLLMFSESFCDHSCVKQQQRIPRSEVQRFPACLCGFNQISVLVESPCKRVPCVYIAPDFKLLSRQIEGFRELHVVIGVEDRQVAIVQYLIDAPEQPNVFDLRILLLGLWLISRLGVEVAKLSDEDGHGNDGDRLLVEQDGVSGSAHISPE